MRIPAVSLAPAVFLILLSAAGTAHSADRPIEGQRLVLKRTATKAKLVFVSRDPNFLFPAIGSADDPTTAGALVELFSASEGQASLAAPAGAGNPGWTSEQGTAPRYKFRNRLAEPGLYSVRLAVIKQGKVLRLAAKDAGLALAVPQGAVGIRITTGGLRNCARFDALTIRKDEAGAFVAAHATAARLVDCSDASLNGLTPSCETSSFPGCGGTCSGDDVCIAGSTSCACMPASSSPCGDTHPACNGTCPAGEECAGGGPPRACFCLPVGSTPCGNPGAPVCGGACPSGNECNPVLSPPAAGGHLGCACAPPGPCEQGGGSTDCPSGFACGQIPQGPNICLPMTCGGSPEYPICGGTCASGAVCQPAKVPQFFTECVCAVPGPCDAGCGGLTCAAGEVCSVGPEPPGCGCGAP